MKTDFKIEFGGNSHELDVNTLTTSLLNFGGIIQEIQQQVAPNGKVDIKVRAPERGIFLLDISLSVPDIIGTAAVLFTATNLNVAENIVSIFANVITLKQHLFGSTPKSIKEDEEGNTTIENHNGQVMVFNNLVVNIYDKNHKIDNLLSNAFRAIQSEDALENIKIKDGKDKVLSEVPSESFEVMATSGLTVELPERRTKIKSGVNVRAYRFSFEDYNKWGFLYEGEKITAKLSDQDFIKLIESNEPFSKGDVLAVDLAVLQELDTSIGGYVNKSFEIVKVNEHIKASQQGKLSL